MTHISQNKIRSTSHKHPTLLIKAPPKKNKKNKKTKNKTKQNKNYKKIRWQNTWFHTKMHGLTQKLPGQHQMPHPACISYHCYN